MKQWIFIALTLTIAIGGGSYLYQQHQEEQKLQDAYKDAYKRGQWQRMVEDVFGHVAEWENLTTAQLNKFVKAGVDINATDETGGTPLHFVVALNEKTGVVKVLINAGADVNPRGKDFTPLHEAALGQNAKIIKELIKAGAKVNAKDRWGNTPLHEAAAYNKNIQTIREFVKAGANINAKNNSGKTPYDQLLKNYNLKNSRELRGLLKPR